MGLQSQLNDVSSDSIPLLLVAIVASCVGYLREALLGLAHSMGLPAQPGSGPTDDPTRLGSGLAGLIVLADHLNLNRRLSHAFSTADDRRCADCAVCLSAIATGDRVRRLSCRHVFHARCLESCITHVSLNCPLCRSPMFADGLRADLTRAKRVGADLVAWFSP